MGEVPLYDMYGGGHFDSYYNDPGRPSHFLDTLAWFICTIDYFLDTPDCFLDTLDCFLDTLFGFLDTPAPTCPSCRTRTGLPRS